MFNYLTFQNMKKIILALLSAMFVFEVNPAKAQISIPPRPKAIKQTFIVSVRSGNLNYVINNGIRTNYRVAPDPVPESPLPPKIVYLLNPEWQVLPPEAPAVKAPKRDSNDFAALVLKFNRERRKLKWIIGTGNEKVYLYDDGKGGRTAETVEVGTRGGKLSYIIRDGKRENFEVVPQPKPQKIIYRPVYIWHNFYFQQPNGQPKEAKSKPEWKPKQNRHDYAQLKLKLQKERWQLLVASGGGNEIIYYYER